MDGSQVVIDFSQICRLCMSDTSDMSPIFAEQVGEVPLPLRIMACVSVELTQTDGLPSQICNSCLCQVDGWYKFKDLCISADTALRKLSRNQQVPYDTITKIKRTAEDVKNSIQLVAKSCTPPEPCNKNEGDCRVQPQAENHHQQQEKHKTFEVVHCENLMNEDSTSDTEPLEILRLQYSTEALQNGTHLPEVAENGDEDSSTDENLSLMAHKEKLLIEKRTRKRVRVRRKGKTSEGVPKVCVTEIVARNIQTQSIMDDEFDMSEEFNVDGFVNIWVDSKMEGQRRMKNKRTQTSRQLLTSKKRFRVRPAVPSACTLCDKVYKNSEILRQHMKSHHVSGSIECSLCQTTFTSLRSLKYHEQRKHSNLEPLPCSFCGKKFLDKKYLRIHENIHSQANQYVCQFCGRKFIMKTNLTVHISRHHTQKTNDFICQVCGKAFPFKLYLKKHFKTHTDYKPHQCQHCEARFRETTLLRKHINSIHLKLRPFLCQYCHKTFTRSLYLREHMESQHLGMPKKMECPRCGETFHNRNRLRQHECDCKMDVL